MLTVRPVPRFVALVAELFGDNALKMHGSKTRPQPRQRGPKFPLSEDS